MTARLPPALRAAICDEAGAVLAECVAKFEASAALALAQMRVSHAEAQLAAERRIAGLELRCRDLEARLTAAAQPARLASVR